MSNRKFTEPRFFENYLLAQLAIVSHQFSADFRDVLRENGMSRSKWRVLSNLYDVSGMYIGELVITALLEQSHITKLTDQLAEEGLVEKAIDDADRRKVIVRITPTGKKVIAPLLEEAKKHEAKVLGDLDPEDAARLKSIMRKLVAPHISKVQRRRSD